MMDYIYIEKFFSMKNFLASVPEIITFCQFANFLYKFLIKH